MRNRDVNRKMFHVGHYNVIASQIRNQIEVTIQAEAHGRENSLHDDSKYLTSYAVTDPVAARNAIIELALSVAKRFQLDNDEFDPVIFLDRCSPDPEVYPLSELWNGVSQTEEVDG